MWPLEACHLRLFCHPGTAPQVMHEPDTAEPQVPVVNPGSPSKMRSAQEQRAIEALMKWQQKQREILMKREKILHEVSVGPLFFDVA